jgi:aminoglycoside phosphotransferase (APT) family kinase protein
LDVLESDWDEVIDTNSKGVFLMAQAAGQAMRAHGRGGSTINVASILGLRQSAGVLPYAMSKAGVIQLRKTLALELARFGIRVNALAPGYLDTDLNSEYCKSDAGLAMVKRIPVAAARPARGSRRAAAAARIRRVVLHDRFGGGRSTADSWSTRYEGGPTRMTAAISGASGTTPVREGHGFDQAALASWMEVNVEGFRGPLTVKQFAGGQSNPTYRLVTPERAYVMRRKPPGPLLRGAHAVEREAQVLVGLAKAKFPVAEVYGLCTHERVIGTWFYVMEMVDGRIFWDATLPQVARAERPAYFDAMNATIAQLHQVDFSSVGLADYGRPGNYFQRQISRWTKQYVEDSEAGRDPDMDRIIEWLPANISRNDETRIVHGDFRVDNLIFHPTEPRVVAVLDWELSTLGHPLADFTYLAMMYHVPPHIVAGLAGADLAALNIPTEAEYVAAYCRRTGRENIPGYAFYIAFNVFRLAAIFHGIKGRVIRGTASSAQAAERAKAFPELAQIAWRQASA